MDTEDEIYIRSLALVSFIGTRNASRNATTNTEIIEIEDLKFSGEVARWWKHSITTTTKNVPKTILGFTGAYGPTCIVESAVDFKKRSSKIQLQHSIHEHSSTYTTGVTKTAKSTTMVQEP